MRGPGECVNSGKSRNSRSDFSSSGVQSAPLGQIENTNQVLTVVSRKPAIRPAVRRFGNDKEWPRSVVFCVRFSSFNWACDSAAIAGAPLTLPLWVKWKVIEKARELPKLILSGENRMIRKDKMDNYIKVFLSSLWIQ